MSERRGAQAVLIMVALLLAFSIGAWVQREYGGCILPVEEQVSIVFP